MDKYERISNEQIEKIRGGLLKSMFLNEFAVGVNNPVFECSLDGECFVPKDVGENDVYLKIFKSGGDRGYEPIIVHL